MIILSDLFGKNEIFKSHFSDTKFAEYLNNGSTHNVQNFRGDRPHITKESEPYSFQIPHKLMIA